MLDKFQVVRGFAGTRVNIVKGGRNYQVDLNTATDDQLKLLHDMKHPAVRKAAKAQPKKSPANK